MDFKSLISKIESIDGKIEAVQAPVLDKAVQLNEDAQLRVLAGQTTYVAEAKKKKDDEMKEEKSSTGGTIDRSKKGVVKHTENPNRYSDEPHAEPASTAKSQSAADKAKDKAADKAHAKDSKDYEKAHGKGSVTRVKDGKKVEGIEPQFKSKFMKMVEAKKEEADAEAKKKKEEKKKKMAKIMDEGAKPDFLDLDKDGDKKEPMKDAAKGKDDDSKDKDSDSKGLSAKQKKLPPGLQKAIAAKSESKMMPKGKKQAVKESVEPKLTFRDMVKLVQESGGQQQIDATDRSLFNWATRVAESKMGAGMKAELYAGLIYERNGGVFEMYDVLSEAEK